MAEKKAETSYTKPIIVTVVVIIFLVAGVFVLQQKKNAEPIVGNTVDEATTQDQADSADNTASTASDAGAIGKNEMRLDDNNFTTKVINDKGVVLVEFYNPTCPHCQKVASDVTATSDTLKGKAKVGKIDASENATSSDKYNVQSVPTFIIFKNGKKVDEAVGEQTKAQLIALVEKALK